MKTKFAKLALAAILSVTGMTTALAHQDYTEAGSDHRVTHLADTKSEPTANQLALYGYVAPGAAARVVNIDSGAKYLNVTRLETVQINAGGKSTSWVFDTLGTAPFSLAKIAPGTEGVTVYVAENPMYRGK